MLTLSHTLDYLPWLLGEVDAVWAFAGKLSSNLELQVEDTAEIGLRFSSGGLGSVHLNYNQRPASHRMEIIGTHGTIQWDNADGAVHVYREGGQEWQVKSPPAGFERNDLFMAQMRHFLSVTRGEAQPVCSLRDGIMALQVALKALESAQCGSLVNIGARR
jgi:predicted dehydrogenase